MRRLSHPHKRFLARVHFWILGLSFLGYLALTFTLGPGFLSFDASQKIQALADELIVVTAIVFGPPATPVVTATPVCVSGSPRILLDWADDAATGTWDVERDSAPLVSGLTTSGYTDSTVTGNVTYDYVVIAYGPMSPGIATSSTVSATAIDCGTILPDPTVTINTIGSTNTVPPRPGSIKVRGSKPRITGTTNVENAIVDISVNRPIIFAQVIANSNGYFTWTPPRSLKPGWHTLTVTVTDPNDDSRTASDSLNFFRRENKTDDDEEDEPLITEVFDQPPFDFILTINNDEAALRQGGRLNFTLKPIRGLLPADAFFEIMFIDKLGKTIFTAPSHTISPIDRPGIEWSVDVPVYLPEGGYTLQVIGTFGETVISRSAPFTLTSLPLLYLGDHGIITYGETASFLGWILFGSLTLLAIFFLFFLREYWLYLHGIRHITERELRRFGLIAFGKEVRK